LYRELLRDARFFELLLTIDEEKAEEVRAGRCPRCGGPLHAGHFERKPRGLQHLPSGYQKRFDLCCGWCRKRTIPPSVRFLGRKVYAAAAVVIATAMGRGSDRNAVQLVRQELGVSPSTLVRWRRWWRELVGSAFWVRTRGQLPVDLDVEGLPASLLSQYTGSASDRMLHLLHWMAPWAATPVPEHVG
jgi:ribosomal protein S27AE